MQNGEFWTNSVCVHVILLYVQRCNSVQSSAFIKLSASDNPTLACNCTLYELRYKFTFFIRTKLN